MNRVHWTHFDDLWINWLTNLCWAKTFQSEENVQENNISVSAIFFMLHRNCYRTSVDSDDFTIIMTMTETFWTPANDTKVSHCKDDWYMESDYQSIGTCSAPIVCPYFVLYILKICPTCIASYSIGEHISLFLKIGFSISSAGQWVQFFKTFVHLCGVRLRYVCSNLVVCILYEN